MKRIVHTKSAEETKVFAAKFAAGLKPGDSISLIGDLGSGKTTFTKGLAEGLGIKDNIRSSSFVLVSEYSSGSAKLYHLDLYRLGEEDIDSIGLDDYVFGDGICVIEWADRAAEKRLNARYRIIISWVDENNRNIEITKLKN